MKINIIKSIISLVMLVTGFVGSAQQVVQPKIMVVPKTTQNEDVREVLEADPAKRIALTVIKDAFDSRGFTTVDFLAKLKNASVKSGLQQDAQTDLKTEIIDGSGADIYVDAEVIFDRQPEGNKVNLILTAYDIATGNSLSNKVGESRRFYSDDVSKLAQKAVESCAEEFLNTLQDKFTDIVENGRTIQIDIRVGAGSSVLLSNETVDGDPLSDTIEEWIEEHAYKANYHLQGTSDKQMVFDEVRIPVRDENGNDFKMRKIRNPLMKTLKELGLNASVTTTGNLLTITIN